LVGAAKHNQGNPSGQFLEIWLGWSFFLNTRWLQAQPGENEVLIFPNRHCYYNSTIVNVTTSTFVVMATSGLAALQSPN